MRPHFIILVHHKQKLIETLSHIRVSLDRLVITGRKTSHSNLVTDFVIMDMVVETIIVLVNCKMNYLFLIVTAWLYGGYELSA